ncbi:MULTISPECIES: hypothetical protein [unclassified Sphingomonas]|uniref:hypothetical protein n=1 Tax=unclassified Sphingomonas TaxID=196159 RepID=UPI0008331690|nr:MULTISPECIES: hypothetical protein [unclassified Sphingomonas]
MQHILEMMRVFGFDIDRLADRIAGDAARERHGLADSLLDLGIATERGAQQRGQRFPVGDARLKVAVLELPPDRYPGKDRDHDRGDPHEQRLEIIDEASDAAKNAVASLAAGRHRIS